MQGCQIKHGKCVVKKVWWFMGSCPNRQYCSKDSYCGLDTEFCSFKQGCQKEYGICTENKCRVEWGFCPEG